MVGFLINVSIVQTAPHLSFGGGPQCDVLAAYCTRLYVTPTMHVLQPFACVPSAVPSNVTFRVSAVVAALPDVVTFFHNFNDPMEADLIFFVYDFKCGDVYGARSSSGEELTFTKCFPGPPVATDPPSAISPLLPPPPLAVTPVPLPLPSPSSLPWPAIAPAPLLAPSPSPQPLPATVPFPSPCLSSSPLPPAIAGPRPNPTTPAPLPAAYPPSIAPSPFPYPPKYGPRVSTPVMTMPSPPSAGRVCDAKSAHSPWSVQVISQQADPLTDGGTRVCLLAKVNASLADACANSTKSRCCRMSLGKLAIPIAGAQCVGAAINATSGGTPVRVSYSSNASPPVQIVYVNKPYSAGLVGVEVCMTVANECSPMSTLCGAETCGYTIYNMPIQKQGNGIICCPQGNIMPQV